MCASVRKYQKSVLDLQSVSVMAETLNESESTIDNNKKTDGLAKNI